MLGVRDRLDFGLIRPGGDNDGGAGQAMVHAERLKSKAPSSKFKMQMGKDKLPIRSVRQILKSFDNPCPDLRVRRVRDGVLAQLVEHHNGIVGVKSSSLLGSTILNSP